MTHRHPRNRAMTQREMIADYLDHRDDELLDAVITAAALVARADGRVEPVERSHLLDFLGRSGLLFVATRTDVLDAFERRLQEFEGRNGARAAAESLRPLAGRSPARFVLDAGEHVAMANGHLHPARP